MTVWLSPLPFFTAKELACKCCGVIKLDVNFAAMLPELRRRWGKVLTPTSACRCPSHNKRVGGHPNSLHLTENEKHKTNGSMAIDIAWRGWPTEEKLKFARLAHSLGFRIGLHNGFCHLDGGRLLGFNPKPFLYGDWSNEFLVDDVL